MHGLAWPRLLQLRPEICGEAYPFVGSHQAQLQLDHQSHIGA